MTRLSLACLAVFVVLGMTQNARATLSPKTVCYFESWVHWRKGEGHIEPKDLDSTLCTHIVYSYFGIEPTTHEIQILDPYLMVDIHDMEHFVQARGQGKALIAIGGAAQSSQFSITAGSDFYLEAFVNSVVSFLSKWGFDGVMIDWTDMRATDSANFIKMLDKFDEKFAHTSMTLGITVPAQVAQLDSYDMPKIVRYVDFINVLSIDYNGPWNLVVDHATPISKQLQTLEDYHKRGAPRSKLVMAVPAFARTWKLRSVDKSQPGDPAASPGMAGPYTAVPGVLSYSELCVLVRSNPSAFAITRDTAEAAVYAVYNLGREAEWISFEDSKTLAAKAANITSMGYAGMSVYTMSNEDVHGICGEKNPLLKSINEHYVKTAVTDGPLPTPPTAAPTQAPVTVPGACTHEGYIRDPVYCFTYYHCKKGDFGTYEREILHCTRHEAFDEKEGKCVDRSKVPGC